MKAKAVSTHHEFAIELKAGFFLLVLLGLLAPAGAQEFKGIPSQPKSNFIVNVQLGSHRFHAANGDTWPLTWASDGNMYGAAGDNQGSPMNFWRIEGGGPV